MNLSGKYSDSILHFGQLTGVAAILDLDAHEKVAAVHEPSTLLVLGSGLIGLAIVARIGISRTKVSSLVVEELLNGHAESRG